MKTRTTRPTGKPSPKTPPPPRTAKPAPGAAFASAAFRAALLWAALFLLALLAYAPALGAGFIWDDQALTENPLVRSLAGLWRIWTSPSLNGQEQHYWPLLYTTFWLEHALVGLQPFLYHLDNILLHGAACVLLWRVLRRLAVPGAWLAAAIFAVHPIHAESVAWVIERKDVLSGLLYFGSALAFLRFHELPASEPPRRRQKLYALSLALFAAALLSKSIAVTLPLALVLALWFRAGRLARRDLLALAPLAALAAALTLADLLFYHGQSGLYNSGLPLPERILMAGRALWLYLAKLAWPHPLATFYPQWPLGLTAASALPGLAWLALLAGLWLARRRLGRGPVAALAFYTLTLAPALGLIDFDFLRLAWVADRFQYLASAGPLALAAAALVLLVRRLRWPEPARRYGAAALLALLGLACFLRATRYHDSVTLFRANVAAYPQSWAAQINLGYALRDAGRGDEAAATLGEAQRRAPEFHMAHALAKILEELGRPQDAALHYQEAVRLKPDFTAGLISYGLFLERQGKLDEAVAQYREAVRVSPQDAAALNNLGNALRSQHKLAESEAQLSRAVALRPEYAECRVNLALTLLEERKIPQTIEQCRRALQSAPNHFLAHVTLGQALLLDAKYPDAAGHFDQARRLQPQSPAAVFLLGQTYEMMRDARQAAQCYQETLRLQPNHPQAAQRLRMLGGALNRP